MAAVTGRGLSCAAMALSVSLPPVVTQTPSEPGLTPMLGDRACPDDHPDNAECFTFTVAADRDDPSGGTIDLPVVVLRATGDSPSPDPLVIPSGGPGAPGIVLEWADTPFIERRDIVLYDQRGTGGTAPSLECPEVDAAFVASLQSADTEAERNATDAAIDTCLARLGDSGVDLTDYHSEASAADLDELRAALGYEQWNIYGASYGGRLALAVMRSFPASIRSVIVDSVYDVTYGAGGDQERALRRLAEGCAADPECAQAHGDLNTTIEQVRERYNAEPAVFDVDLGDGNGPQRFVITGDDMLAGLFFALYDSTLIPLLPSIIDGLLTGDTGIVPVMIERFVPFLTMQADAMALAVNCADNAGFSTAMVDAFGNEVFCPADWPATPGEFNAPVVSDIPALVLAGWYDPITPAEGTRHVAEHLSNSTFLLVGSGGHGVLFFPCVLLLSLAFLDDPATELDTACVEDIPRPEFQ